MTFLDVFEVFQWVSEALLGHSRGLRQVQGALQRVREDFEVISGSVRRFSVGFRGALGDSGGSPALREILREPVGVSIF